MDKLKIGDKVKIIFFEDLHKESKKYDLRFEKDGFWISGGFRIAPEMLKYLGKTATITEIVDEVNGKFRIDIDEGWWSWDIRLFKILQENECYNSYVPLKGSDFWILANIKDNSFIDIMFDSKKEALDWLVKHEN